jgi:hypothetical protein
MSVRRLSDVWFSVEEFIQSLGNPFGKFIPETIVLKEPVRRP